METMSAKTVRVPKKATAKAATMVDPTPEEVQTVVAKMEATVLEPNPRLIIIGGPTVSLATASGVEQATALFAEYRAKGYFAYRKEPGDAGGGAITQEIDPYAVTVMGPQFVGG